MSKAHFPCPAQAKKIGKSQALDAHPGWTPSQLSSAWLGLVQLVSKNAGVDDYKYGV
jgi:hypothetical protein